MGWAQSTSSECIHPNARWLSQSLYIFLVLLPTVGRTPCFLLHIEMPGCRWLLPTSAASRAARTFGLVRCACTAARLRRPSVRQPWAAVASVAGAQSPSGGATVTISRVCLLPYREDCLTISCLLCNLVFLFDYLSFNVTFLCQSHVTLGWYLHDQ